ncbi:MAG: DUF2865 domain-containing protein [Bosea sp. (in: a-proteobacteria)]
MSFRFRQLIVVLATLAGWPAVALAQSQQCDAWRGELSRMDRGGGGSPRAAAAAQQVAAQLGRAQAAFSNMQCDGAWIFQAAPPQCNSLRGQIGQLRAQYASLQQQAGGGGGNENRRRALLAAIDDNCRSGVLRSQPIAPQPQQQQPRTLFEALFGVPDRPPPPPGMPELDGPVLDASPGEKREPTWGAGRPVCVRTCDGFFFPLSNSPGGRENQDDMCQALCPAAETEVFYMAGDGDIQNASRRGGGTYAGLANAGRYLRQFDAACSCKKQGQSWAQALSEAEDMLDRRRGDVMVTEQRAAEMSRARPTAQSRREAERQARAGDQAPTAPASDVAADAAAARALEASGRAAPTAGTDSAGIGPNGLATGTVSAAQGERRVVTNSAGEQRTVRIVAPAFTPAIQ